MQNFVAVSHTKCAHVRGLENFRDAESCLLGWGSGCPLKRPSSRLLRYKIRLLLFITIWAYLGVQSTLGTLGPRLLRMDHKMTLSGRGLGHVTQFRNLGPPYNF